MTHIFYVFLGNTVDNLNKISLFLNKFVKNRSEILFALKINFQESICTVGGTKNYQQNVFTYFTGYLN